MKTMQKGAIFALFYLISTLSLNAQMNYQKVDSLSYTLYANGEWEALTELGDLAAENGFDYYYFNLRVGIAYYQLGDFKKAEKWLDKALNKNAFGDVAKEYLFWIYWQDGRERDAANLFEELPENVKKSIEFNPKKWVDFAYIEQGLKIAPDNDTAGLFTYAHLGLKHNIAPFLDIYHAYSFINQDFSWGDFKQHQYYFAPTVHLPKGWDIGLGGNYFDFKRNFEFNYDSTTVIQFDSIFNDTLTYKTVYDINVKTSFKGQYKLTAWYPSVHITKSWKNFNFSLQYAWYGEKVTEDFLELSDTLTITTLFLNESEVYDSLDTSMDEILHNETTEQFQHQLGFTADYTWRFSPVKSLTLGLESHLILREDEDMSQVFVPYFSANLSKKISINGYWMQKGNHPLSIAKGSLVFNNYDEYKHRISTTLRYQISPKASFFGTLQWDQKIDDFSGASYNSYGAIAGFKINF